MTDITDITVLVGYNILLKHLGAAEKVACEHTVLDVSVYARQCKSIVIFSDLRWTVNCIISVWSGYFFFL